MSGYIPQQNGNDSSTGGFIVPSTGPTSKTEFEDTVSSIISGVTGIPRSLVRPRWQPTPPTQPTFDTNWVAFGVVRKIRDANPYIRHIGGLDDGQDESQRHVIIETLCSFYGPDSLDLSEVLRDGLRIEQNFYPLLAIDAGINDVESSIRVPELINNQWVDRTDVTIRFIQREVRIYPVLSLKSASGALTAEEYSTSYSAHQPLNVTIQLVGIPLQATVYRPPQDANAAFTGVSFAASSQDPVYNPSASTLGATSSIALGDTTQSDSTNLPLSGAIIYSGVMGSLTIVDTGGFPLTSGTGLLHVEIDKPLTGTSIIASVEAPTATVAPGAPGGLQAFNPNTPLLDLSFILDQSSLS